MAWGFQRLVGREHVGYETTNYSEASSTSPRTEKVNIERLTRIGDNVQYHFLQ